MKSIFKRTIKWNIDQSKVTIQNQKRYLDYFIDLSFQGVNKLFVLLFRHDTRINCKRYYLLDVEIKDYKNGKKLWENFFDRPVKNNLRTCDTIHKIINDQGDYYTTGLLLNYSYFKKYYKMIATDLSKHQVLYGDLTAMQ